MADKYLVEAFQKLDILDEDTFDITGDEVKKLSDFVSDDEMEEVQPIVDPLAQSDEELQDSYIGKVILDCTVCQTKIYKDASDVVVSEDGTLANVGEECPYCHTSDGYKIIGEVAPYSKTDVNVEVTPKEDGSEEAKIDLTTDDDTLEEDVDRFTNKVSQRVVETLDKAYKNFRRFGHFAVLFKHNPGTGAINAATNWAKDKGLNLQSIDASTMDKTDIAGALVPGRDGRVERAPGINIKPNTILLLDNIDRASQDVINCLLSVIDKNNVIAFVDVNSDHYNLNQATLNRFIVIDLTDGSLDEGCKTKKGVDKLKSLKKEGIKEDLNGITIDTDEETINVTATEKAEDGEEMIAPITDETKEEIKSEGEEDLQDVEEPEYQDFDIDEFDESQFDDLGESYMKKVYENVASYKTVKGSVKGNLLKLEGIITFKSGKKAKTNFVFEASTTTKTGKVKFLGENKQFARGRKSFTLTGKVKGNKLIAESLTYNYRAKDAKLGSSKRLYGTIRK